MLIVDCAKLDNRAYVADYRVFRLVISLAFR